MKLFFNGINWELLIALFSSNLSSHKSSTLLNWNQLKATIEQQREEEKKFISQPEIEKKCSKKGLQHFSNSEKHWIGNFINKSQSKCLWKLRFCYCATIFYCSSLSFRFIIQLFNWNLSCGEKLTQTIINCLSTCLYTSFERRNIIFWMLIHRMNLWQNKRHSAQGWLNWNKRRFVSLSFIFEAWKWRLSCVLDNDLKRNLNKRKTPT